MEHKCSGFEEAGEGLWGSAISDICFNPVWYKDMFEVGWWMDNGEYATGPIYYCPFCGIELVKLLEKTDG